MDAGLRIALVSMPRSGNTWLRHMLVRALELESTSAHLPSEVNWDSLRQRMVLQIHWPRDEAFLSRLRQHDFRTVVLARHPLDVLISALVFSQHDESTLRWLGGAGGDERTIAGASPTSDAFLDYATGPRARAILGVSAQWWTAADVCRVRFEDLVRNPLAQLTGLLAALGVDSRQSLAEIVAESNAEGMRSLSVGMSYFVWQAQCGLWKQLLTAPAARRICDAHQDLMKSLGYVCDPDESLLPADAEHTWRRLEIGAVKRTLYGLKRSVIDVEQTFRGDLARQRANAEALARQSHDLEQLRAELARQRGELDAQRSQLDDQLAQLKRQRAELESLAADYARQPWEQIHGLAGLGPWSIGAARGLHRWSLRFPRAARGVKTLARFAGRLSSGPKASTSDD